MRVPHGNECDANLRPGQTCRAGYYLMTQEQIEEIIDKSATRAVEQFYAGVGKSVVKTVFVLVGIVAAAIVAYLKSTVKFTV